MPRNALLQTWRPCCYCSHRQCDCDIWLSETGRENHPRTCGKATGSLTGTKAKGKSQPASDFHHPVTRSAVYMRCCRYLSRQGVPDLKESPHPWGLVTWQEPTWPDTARHGQPWPALLAGCALQRLERTKQQQNYFHSGAGDSGCGQWPRAVDGRAQALLMTPRSRSGWGCPSPLPPCHQGPTDLPPRPPCLSWGSWPQAGWWGGWQGRGRWLPLPPPTNQLLSAGGTMTS